MSPPISDMLDQSCPPASTFSVDDIPDLSGKVMIVTGANTGVGKETAKALLAKNAKVYIAARSEEKALSAIEELKEATGNEGIWLKLDLSDLKSVKAAAQEFMRKEQVLHVLFNNAGVMIPPFEQLTEQGYDLQWGTNVLGHFYFSKLLVPALTAGAKSSPEGKSRIVNTASSGAMYVNTVKFDTLVPGEARKKLGNSALYMQSKLGNVLISNEMSRRWSDFGIVTMAVNPGNLKSDLQRHTPKLVTWILDKTMLFPVPMGALTQLYGGTMKEGLEFNGQYLIPWARVGKQPPGYTEELAKVAWEWCEEKVKNI